MNKKLNFKTLFLINIFYLLKIKGFFNFEKIAKILSNGINNSEIAHSKPYSLSTFGFLKKNRLINFLLGGLLMHQVKKNYDLNKKLEYLEKENKKNEGLIEKLKNERSDDVKKNFLALTCATSISPFKNYWKPINSLLFSILSVETAKNINENSKFKEKIEIKKP